jgi:hypothetical protein
MDTYTINEVIKIINKYNPRKTENINSKNNILKKLVILKKKSKKIQKGGSNSYIEGRTLRNISVIIKKNLPSYINYIFFSLLLRFSEKFKIHVFSVDRQVKTNTRFGEIQFFITDDELKLFNERFQNNNFYTWNRLKNGIIINNRGYEEYKQLIESITVNSPDEYFERIICIINNLIQKLKTEKYNNEVIFCTNQNMNSNTSQVQPYPSLYNGKNVSIIPRSYRTPSRTPSPPSRTPSSPSPPSP